MDILSKLNQIELTFLSVHEFWTSIQLQFYNSLTETCANVMIPGTFFAEFKGSLSILCKSMCFFGNTCIDQIRSRFCTSHDSSAVVACANLWPERILKTKLDHKEFTQELINLCQMGPGLEFPWLWRYIDSSSQLTVSPFCRACQCVSVHVLIYLSFQETYR